MAEIYHIYDYTRLPLTTVAIFVKGLKANSRLYMAIQNQEMSLAETLLCGINDRLSLILWSKTKDAEKGLNKPKLLLSDKEVKGFSSSEEFEKARERIVKGG